MMEPEIPFWYWFVFGMLLVITETIIPTITILWFGLGALIVGCILFFVPELTLSWQFFLWAAASSLFTFLWFKLLKPQMVDRTKAGISLEAIVNETGQIVKAPMGKNHGIVRFTTPVLGADEWPFICEQAVTIGDRVVVKNISGNTLIVEKKAAPGGNAFP
ncbi:MAG: NfeD family protein [Thermodesulfobacteriota bacterium]